MGEHTVYYFRLNVHFCMVLFLFLCPSGIGRGIMFAGGGFKLSPLTNACFKSKALN